MNIAVVKNNSNNIFAAFGDKVTQYDNPPIVLRNKLYLSNLITKKNYGDVFITTYLSSEKKSCGSNVSPDIENILLYNLREYRPINDLISMADKIIIQGIDNLKIKPPKINWEKWHYYFYGTFDKNNYKDSLLYEWDYSKCPRFCLDIKDFNKLINSIDKNEDLRLILNRYSSIKDPVVPKNTKYVLRIECPLILYEAVENLKNLIDTVIIFCNDRNIIEHPYRNQLVEIKNGEQYNPTDDFLYYCEIKRENIGCIKFYVAPILNNGISNCGRVREDKVYSFPGFRSEDEIRFCGEEENIIEKQMPKKNNPNNFPGFKKEDEIIHKELNIANNINNQNNTWNCNARNNPECIIELFKKHIELFNDKNYTVDRKTVEKWLNDCKNENNCDRQIRDIGTTLSDMVSPIHNGNKTSLMPDIERVLDRPQTGRYRIDIDLLEKYEQSKK
jgi:hypothetical protein